MHTVVEDVRVEFGDSFYGMGEPVGSLVQEEHMEVGHCTSSFPFQLDVKPVLSLDATYT